MKRKLILALLSLSIVVALPASRTHVADLAAEVFTAAALFEVAAPWFSAPRSFSFYDHDSAKSGSKPLLSVMLPHMLALPLTNGPFDWRGCRRRLS
ncbi:MAG: hypothetical protein ABSC37_10850 [Xanthobacteraceae bacterium]